MSSLYNSLLNRKLEAEIAVSMERKQKGEQFRIIDSAKMPARPISPNTQKIFLIALIVGLGLGGGLTYLVELMDTSFKNPEDAEKDLELPVLVSMPIRYTDKELKNRNLKSMLAGASIAAGFILSATGILFASKGIDTTVVYFKNIIGKL